MKIRGRRANAMLAVALLALTMHGARASDVGAGCGSPAGGYSRTASCVLVFRGFPIYVYGTASATGTTTVHVWATIEELEGMPQHATLVECTTSDAGYAQCDRGLPDETTKVENTALQQFHLRCHVQSNGTGSYRCVSGSGL